MPKDYAQKYDKGKQSTYGQHQVFTGPYMIENDGKGKITGYQPAKKLTLVRNPSWDKSTDFKPAYFDRIEETCCSDANVATKKTLERAELPQRRLRGPAPRGAEVGAFVAEGPGHDHAEHREPLHSAEHDGQAARQRQRAAGDQRGHRQAGAAPDARRPVCGTIATHLLPPGIGGFEEAGGEKGPGFDFVSSPTANVPLAKKYMKKAGYKNGMYDGPPLLTVADNVSPAKETGEAFQEQVKKIGIKLQLREVPHATLLSKFCNVP